MNTMTTEIRFKDEEFSFTQDGTAYFVRTEVGNNQPARVLVNEVRKQEETPMEPEGEEG